jgi:hypothetical protein
MYNITKKNIDIMYLVGTGLFLPYFYIGDFFQGFFLTTELILYIDIVFIR